MANNKYGEVINLEKYANDGRLTEPSDGTRFEWRKMIDEVKKLGRPLTEKESEKFKIKQYLSIIIFEVGNGSRRTLKRVPEMMDTPPIQK